MLILLLQLYFIVTSNIAKIHLLSTLSITLWRETNDKNILAIINIKFFQLTCDLQRKIYYTVERYAIPGL